MQRFIRLMRAAIAGKERTLLKGTEREKGGGEGGHEAWRRKGEDFGGT